MKYRNRLAELRRKHNLTQADVAELLGVHRTTYANYEQGTRAMDHDLLIRLADYYKVSLDYLFERTDIPFDINSYSKDEVELMTGFLDLYRQTKQKFFS